MPDFSILPLPPKEAAMQQATLQFNSLSELWKFKTNISALNIFVDAGKRLLTAELSHMDIQLALNRFAATLVS